MRWKSNLRAARWPVAALAVGFIFVFLTGCTETGAKLTAAGSDLVDAGIAYERTIIVKRQEARYNCIRIRERIARDLEAEEPEKALKAWAVLHRDLSIIQAIQDKDAGAILAGLNEAWPCASERP